MEPLLKLLARYPTRRCQVFEDDYERAKSELNGELVPFFDPAVARAIVNTWEALARQTNADAGRNAELYWIEIHADGAVQTVFHDQAVRESAARTTETSPIERRQRWTSSAAPAIHAGDGERIRVTPTARHCECDCKRTV